MKEMDGWMNKGLLGWMNKGLFGARRSHSCRGVLQGSRHLTEHPKAGMKSRAWKIPSRISSTLESLGWVLRMWKGVFGSPPSTCGLSPGPAEPPEPGPGPSTSQSGERPAQDAQGAEWPHREFGTPRGLCPWRDTVQGQTTLVWCQTNLPRPFQPRALLMTELLSPGSPGCSRQGLCPFFGGTDPSLTCVW